MSTNDIDDRRLRRGRVYPFDAPDAWPGPGEDYDYDSFDPFPAPDWAHAAARGIVADLRDRRGVKDGFDGIIEEVRCELVASLANIIRRAGKDVVRDAARYQWLRAENAYAPEEHQVTGGEELDQLCDNGLADELYAK